MGRSERGCADVCGRCGCKGKGWKWMGSRTGGHERAWMRGRVRTVWVQGKRLETGGEQDRLAGASMDAHVCGRCGCKGKGWKWVGRRTGGHERAWMRGCVRTADGVGARGGKGKGHEGAWMRGRVDGVGCKGKVGNGQGRRAGKHGNGLGEGRVARASVDGRACADGVEILH